MQFSIPVESLKQNKLFVAIPMYGGQCFGMCAKSLLDLQSICIQFGIEVRFSFIFNESLITRARNYLVDEFLRSGFSHLLFIDSDIHFDPRDVVHMMSLDRDVIGAPYPKKSLRWDAVKTALTRKPDIDANELQKVVGDFVFNPVPGTEKFSVNEPVEVLELGTGFMMVKRAVFEKFEKAYPELRYKPDHVGQNNFDGSRYIHAFFDTVIDRGNSDRYLSEDYMFCQWWRKIGGQIWLCPWMRTHHIGTYAFTGDLPAVGTLCGIPVIIGLVGPIGSGKGTVADTLVDRHGFIKESFAKPVKDAVSVIFGLNRSLLEGDNEVSREWRETVHSWWSEKLGQPTTPRQLLQLMGTEAARDVFHEDIWVHSLEMRLDETKNYVIADVRFPNEMKMITDLGGKIVRVKRGDLVPWYNCAYSDNVCATNRMPDEFPDIHYSEWAWIGSQYINMTLDNNCSKLELPKRVAMMLDWLYNTHMEDNLIEVTE